MFPGAPEPFLDLSTGINPVPYPLPTFAPDCFTRLPEPEAEAALLSAAAAAYGAIDPSLLAAAPGTQILIDLLPRLWPAEQVAVLGPTYAEHAHAWSKIGASVSTVAHMAALEGASVAVVCNPNNPDGRRIAPDRLLALADRLHARGGLLVVDEAFADLEDDCLSLAGALPHPAIIVLRSFGKTYGLAGVQLIRAGSAGTGDAHSRCAGTLGGVRACDRRRLYGAGGSQVAGGHESSVGTRSIAARCHACAGRPARDRWDAPVPVRRKPFGRGGLPAPGPCRHPGAALCRPTRLAARGAPWLARRLAAARGGHHIQPNATSPALIRRVPLAVARSIAPSTSRPLNTPRCWRSPIVTVTSVPNPGA